MSVHVHLDDVRVILGKTEILHGISLEAKPGELLTLLGPSGSGKTTTLNVVAGLAPVASGSLHFDGVPMHGRAVHDRDIGIVFQSYALFPHMKVGQNVEFPLLTRKVAKRERRETAKRMLELVHLPDMYRRSVGSLSGGQQQRVALARALAASPGVLLLDEPMAALDKQLRERMQHEIKRIQHEVGVTTIAVTHDQTEALTMSDRVAIMRDGHIEQVDTPDQLYRRPATLFAARFLGEANLLPVREGRLQGFDEAVAGARTGTAVLRPEELTLSGRARPDAPCVTARVETTSFQGSRFRVDAVHPQLGHLLVSLPPDTEPVSIAAGLEIEIACPVPAAVHVITDVEATAEDALETAVAAAAEADGGTA